MLRGFHNFDMLGCLTWPTHSLHHLTCYHAQNSERLDGWLRWNTVPCFMERWKSCHADFKNIWNILICIAPWQWCLILLNSSPVASNASVKAVTVFRVMRSTTPRHDSRSGNHVMNVIWPFDQSELCAKLWRPLGYPLRNTHRP